MELRAQPKPAGKSWEQSPADSSGAAVPRPAVAVRNKPDGKLVAGAYGARTAPPHPRTATWHHYLRVGGIGFTPMNTEEFKIRLPR